MSVVFIKNAKATLNLLKDLKTLNEVEITFMVTEGSEELYDELIAELEESA